MRSFVFKFVFTLGVLGPYLAQADKPGSGIDFSNPLPFLLFGTVAILVLGNLLLANVIRQLADALLDRNRKERAQSTVAKTTLILLAMLLPALPVFAQEATEAVPELSFWQNTAPIGGMDRFQFLAVLAIIFVLFCIMLGQATVVNRLVRQLRGIPHKEHVPALIFRKNFLDVFNKSVAIEKEDTIMLDHDYDGIRELDNDLPPWWKYGFILTIVVSVLYLGYYHAWGGPSQLDEYNAAVEKAEEEKAAYLAKSGVQVDENTVTLVQDPGELAEAKVLYANVCAACHGAAGGGTVGPNLTDDYWIHGGSLKEVFKSIKYGWKDKGMPPWDGNLSAKQIANMSSYVKSLKDTKPVGAKAPQGDLFVEGNDNALDSVSNQTEPSLTPTGTTENKNNPIGPYNNKADGKGEGMPPGKVL